MRPPPAPAPLVLPAPLCSAASREPPTHPDTFLPRAEYVVTGLDELANWARKGSMWPMTFGLA